MREKNRERVYCFSREPGGSEAVALTLKGQRSSSYILIAKDYADQQNDIRKIKTLEEKINTLEPICRFIMRMWL